MADKFTQLLPLLGALVAFLLAALLLIYIFRLVFGKRIRAPGPRNRPRRLDVVDVFDLDKERQLVIVRRDNTEHLLLIGGPNDVLVEGAINRADQTTNRNAPTAAGANWPTPPTPVPDEPAPETRPAATGLKPPAPLNLPPDLFAQKSPAPSSATAPAVSPAPSSSVSPPPPISSAPPRASLGLSTPPARPTPPPRPPGMPSFLSRTQRVITPKQENEEGVSAPPAAPEAQRPAPPIFAPATQRSAPPPPPETPKASPPPPPPPPPAQRPVMPTVKESSEAPNSDPLDSLEEEMARLLGRTDKE